MAWKDKYMATYGQKLKIDYTPSAPESWKDRYLKELQARDEAAALREEEQAQRDAAEAARAETAAEVYKKQQSLYDLAMEMQNDAHLSELDRQKREQSGDYQNYFDAEKRSYQYGRKRDEYLTEAQALINDLKGYEMPCA